MARLTKNNKRSIKSTWREINWHVEGSAGGAAAGAGGTPSLGSPTPPGPPPCPAAGSLVPMPGGQEDGEFLVLALGTARPLMDAMCPRKQPGLPWAPSVPPQVHGPPKVPRAPCCCASQESSQGHQNPFTELPRHCRPSTVMSPRDRGEVTWGHLALVGEPPATLWACCGSPRNTWMIREPQAGSAACADTY